MSENIFLFLCYACAGILFTITVLWNIRTVHRVVNDCYGAVISALMAACVVFALFAMTCTPAQRRIAHEVIDVVEAICAAEDSRDACLDKVAASRGVLSVVEAVNECAIERSPPVVSDAAADDGAIGD